MSNVNWRVGDYAKVIGQDIAGYVVAVHESTIVLRDVTLDNYEGDNCLEFRFREVRKIDRSHHTNRKEEL